MHRVASLAKRWLLGTHQGSVDEAHLQAYLDEFVFRFNRRTSRSRGLVFYRVLQLAVGHEPVRYRDLVVNPQPKKRPPTGRRLGSSTQPGPPASRPPLENRLTGTGPVKWIPPTALLIGGRLVRPHAIIPGRHAQVCTALPADRRGRRARVRARCEWWRRERPVSDRQPSSCIHTRRGPAVAKPLSSAWRTRAPDA